MSRKVFAYINFPAQAPTHTSLIVLLLIREFNIPPIVQGVLWTIVGILWIIFFVGVCTQDIVDLFKK